MDQKKIPDYFRLLFFSLFFLSGFCALVYENVWFKILRLIFGNTTFALSTVLASYMAGLALGSWLLGKYIDKKGNPLVAYGVLEIIIGVLCYGTLYAKGIIESIYVGIYQAIHLPVYGAIAVRFILAFVLMAIPTVCMGGTLPVLSRFFIQRLNAVGRDIAVLYSLNTLGACCGVIVSGFVLFPNLGIGRIVFFTALANVVIGALSLVGGWYLRRYAACDVASLCDDVSFVPPARFSRAGKTLLWGFGLSGAVTMLYEIVWTRILAMLIGSSVYAFSVMLGTFLAGLVIGSTVYRYVFGRVPVRLRFFGLIQICIGGAVVLLLPCIQEIPFLFLKVFKMTQGNTFLFQTGMFALCALLMAIPTILIGMTFPMVSQLYVRNKEELGGAIGRVYAVNTVGNIAGAVIAGFVLVPWLGIHATLVVGVLINCGIGVAVWRNDSPGKNSTRVVAVLCAVVIAAGYLYPWPKQLLTSGIQLKVRKWMNLPKKKILDNLRDFWTLAFYKDGLNCTVSVNKTAQFTYLKVNGKTDASTGETDMGTQILCGYIPLLFVDDPEDVFIVGLGSGITVSGCADFPVKRIDVAEIEAAVVDASAFFRQQNKGVLDDARVRVHIEDGRNYLLRQQGKYDVIISEPSNPWIEGVASLFTKEFYRLMRARVKPGGVVCQWVQLYSMDIEDIKRALKTFHDVFPYVSVWESNDSDLLIIGGNEPLRLDLRRLQDTYEQPLVRNRLQELGFKSPISLLSGYLFDQRRIKELPEKTALNTDDLNILEYSAPRSLYRQTIGRNREFLSGYRGKRSDVVSAEADKRAVGGLESRVSFIHTYLLRADPERAESELDALLREFPDDIQRYFNLVLIYQAKQKYVRAIEVLRNLVKREEDPKYYYYLGVIYERTNAYADAEEVLRRSVALAPRELKPYLLLGRVLRHQGKYTAAVDIYQSALTYHPANTSLPGLIRKCKREIKAGKAR